MQLTKTLKGKDASDMYQSINLWQHLLFEEFKSIVVAGH